MPSYGLHWFRRDLRITGNPALQRSWKLHQGRVLGVFFFDPSFLSRPDFSPNRFQFFLETLKALREEWRETGGELLFLEEGPQAGFRSLLELLQRRGSPLPATVSFNRDYEPFARERDAQIQRLLEPGIRLLTERDHLLVEPWELAENRPPYKVFTPFWKRWRHFIESEVGQQRIAQQRKSFERKPIEGPLWKLVGKDLLPSVTFPDLLEKYIQENRARVTIPLPPAGSRAAIAAVRAFQPSLESYGGERDFPGKKGTSRLSIYLKNGSMTLAQIAALLELERNPSPSAQKYLSELAWREFYYHILYHFPHVEQQPFQERYANLRWENSQAHFEQWCAGRTGFPLVDAGMRELLQTGWMHNRVRMVVASFLTKDLLIDWRWGERFFMNHLLDGDLAPNNGGWQWAASTGCDPQPYFRIFNPDLQARRFDPDGSYVARFAPDAATLPRIVDHATQREKAIRLFQAAAKG